MATFQELMEEIKLRKEEKKQDVIVNKFNNTKVIYETKESPKSLKQNKKKKQHELKNSSKSKNSSSSETTLKRGNKLSITFAHIIPHLAKMEPEKIRIEVAKVGLNLIKNNTKINPITKKSLAVKIRIIINLPDAYLIEHVTNLALWLDKLIAEDNGTTFAGSKQTGSKQISEFEENQGKTAREILNILHFTYGLKFADIEGSTPKNLNRIRMKIWIGPNRTALSWDSIVRILNMKECSASIYIDAPGHQGKIRWIDANADQIAVQIRNGKENGNRTDDDGNRTETDDEDETDNRKNGKVFESVYEAVPWLSPI